MYYGTKTLFLQSIIFARYEILVAESMDKQCLLIGKCKWTRQENATALLSDLRHRADKFPLARNHKVYYALFLKNPPIDGENENVFLPQDIINEFS